MQSDKYSDPIDIDPGARFDPKELFVYGVARSRRLVLASVAAGGLIGLLVGVTRPNVYTSNMRLLLRLGAREQITPETIVGLENGRDVGPTLQDEVLMLTDPAIFRAVAEEQGPENILRPADPGQFDNENTSLAVRFVHWIQASMLEDAVDFDGASEDRLLFTATQVLMDNTTVDAEWGSNVISVEHTSSSPQRAQEVTQALTEHFIARHRSEYDVREAALKGRERMLEAFSGMDEAQRAYGEHTRLCGFHDITSEKVMMAEGLASLQRELDQRQSEREENEAERIALVELIKTTPETVVELKPARWGVNPAFEIEQATKTSLVFEREQLELQPISKNERKRRREAIEGKLRDLEKRIENMPREVVVVPETRVSVDNPDVLAMRSRVLEIEAADKRLSTSIAMLTDRLAQREQRMEALWKCVDLHRTMKTTIEDKERAHQHLSESFYKLEALSSVDRHDEANLRVLQAPTFEREKSGPNRFKLLALGLFAGALVGLCVAILRQAMDRRLRYPESVERSLGVPLLGVIPEIRPGHRRAA